MQYDHEGHREEVAREWRKPQAPIAWNDPAKPKYYVLDMFPYPSGAGLHVGHPLGYIASDIVARYKRHNGFNVLHPMGYDSFGLPAEQYAIQTGQHPAKTTEENIARYREQLDNIGFSFDWSREVRTSEPAYYKWTQWIFLQLFDSWYDPRRTAGRPIAELIARFERQGCQDRRSALTGDVEESLGAFTAAEWKPSSERTQQWSCSTSAGLPQRCLGELVPRAGHRARQRRGEGRCERTRRPSRGTQADAAMEHAHHRLCATPARWPG
jgi:leucyl-tRNA synthetase